MEDDGITEETSLEDVEWETGSENLREPLLRGSGGRFLMSNLLFGGALTLDGHSDGGCGNNNTNNNIDNNKPTINRVSGSSNSSRMRGKIMRTRTMEKMKRKGRRGKMHWGPSPLTSRVPSR
mmetsp:Transcript_50420/g.108694  ORF Transcript_50420/g.108694 Transcript_50420/m.108694 type:complete len:122 (+) Transcript_50420:39-404(+)